MQYSEFQTNVALRLANMQTTSPFYTTYISNATTPSSTWPNQATNQVILRALSKKRRKLNLFPELRDKWISNATTTNDVSYVERPSDCLWVTDLYSFDSASAPDEDTSERHPMVEIQNYRDWELLNKAQTGYPRLWNRYGDRIQLHPVPDTSYLTYWLVLGIAQESVMSASGDTPVLNVIWHSAVESMAVYIGATAMGWDEDAERALAACDRQIEQSLSISGVEDGMRDIGSEVRGDPTRGYL